LAVLHLCGNEITIYAVPFMGVYSQSTFNISVAARLIAPLLHSETNPKTGKLSHFEKI